MVMVRLLAVAVATFLCLCLTGSDAFTNVAPSSTLRRESPARAGAKVFTYEEGGPTIVWTASKFSRRAVEVQPGGRSLKDYLALPPTEYSLLDPSMVQRINDEEFCFTPGKLKLLGSVMEPQVFLRVMVDPSQPSARICVERVEMGGSSLMMSTNGHFQCSSTTVVRQDMTEDGQINLVGEVDLFIEVQVPKENFFPVKLIQKTGNFMMQQIVGLGTPSFVRFLAKDYERWSRGDDSRGGVIDEGERLLALGPSGGGSGGDGI